jgi:hypothetical protein
MIVQGEAGALRKLGDSIWVAWIKEVLLKGRTFWSVSISQNSTWCYKIFKV